MEDGIEEASSRVASFYDSSFVPPPLLVFYEGLNEVAMPASFKDKEELLWDTKRYETFVLPVYPSPPFGCHHEQWDRHFTLTRNKPRRPTSNCHQYQRQY